MATISESLDAQITAATVELARLDTDYAANKRTAQGKLALLQRARAVVTPQLDQLVAELQAAGVWPKT